MYSHWIRRDAVRHVAHFRRNMPQHAVWIKSQWDNANRERG